jgi:outer membrane protein OmpA-like peptidoglycan-associated protein
MFVDPNTRQPGQLDFRLTGTIKRIEPKPVPFPVIVNDRRVELPAVHAKGTFIGEEGDFLFLDDPNNPLSLRFTIGQDHLNVVTISFPPQDSGGAQLAPELARALEEHGRTEVHGIYFEFASAAIKPESEPVLVAIATLFAQHPTWKVSIEGHTDNIGGDAYNLDLSRRRSAAVKDALGKRYQVGADRLTTAGFGVSRPKETNDTLEGRARNRRVELVRQ